MVIVAAVIGPAIHALANELTRDALSVEIATADVLREPAIDCAPPTDTARSAAPAVATACTYLFAVDSGVGVALADQIVAWASQARLRPGLIGVIDDGGASEREALLAAGFDDVVAGPVSVREISARVRAVHRRVHWVTAGGRLRYGAFTLDLDGHALWFGDAAIALTSAELAVIRELIKARGKPLSRTMLLDAAWGDGDLEISERAVDNVILRLRRKLPRPELIETVRSVGFRLAAD